MTKVRKCNRKTILFWLFVIPLFLYVLYVLNFRGTAPQLFFKELASNPEEFSVKIESEKFRLNPKMGNKAFMEDKISEFAKCLRNSESTFLSIGQNLQDVNIRIYFSSSLISYEVDVFWRPPEKIAYVMSYASKTTKEKMNYTPLKAGNYGGACLHDSLYSIVEKK